MTLMIDIKITHNRDTKCVEARHKPFLDDAGVRVHIHPGLATKRKGRGGDRPADRIQEI